MARNTLRVPDYVETTTSSHTTLVETERHEVFHRTQTANVTSTWEFATQGGGRGVGGSIFDFNPVVPCQLGNLEHHHHTLL